ncbi:MAG: cytochrome b N-terminal domain-containing protein [Rickettsiaceae bacterium]|nr:cytochrome b N-terminal domain-containing protein [Rickettsiaceae bacterium]
MSTEHNNNQINQNEDKSNSSIAAWIDYRIPAISFIFHHLTSYKVPRNLNYMWNFGAIASLGLVIQIITGLILSMHYTPHVDYAFDSVESIMRNVNYGWLIRYFHAVGASMFFAATYIHMLRSLYYGSYKYPRELLWQIGLVIFLTMMATAFTGYVLPWGQMSYWAATVITNIFSAIPFVGESIVTWLWGGFSVGNPTLNRFFSLHYLLPFVILALVVLHVLALHTHGSNNPTGVDPKPENKINFHPYYTMKDLYSFGFYFMVFAYFVFWQPNYLGHPDNYVEANPLVTPAHIVPEWYFLPFYAMLRSVPSKLGGAITMFSAIFVLFFLPWLDRSKVKSCNNRKIYRVFLIIFIANALLLGFIGGKPLEEPYITIGRLSTLYYFVHLFFILPFVSIIESKSEQATPIQS